MTSYGHAVKPTLVLISGFLGQESDWQTLQTALKNEVHCVVVDVSWPFSQQAASDIAPANFDDSCDQLFTRLLKQYQLPPQFVVLGYSMGGRIALSWAQRHSARMSQLILESCHPGLTTEEERQVRLTSDALWAQRFAKEPLTEVLGDWYRQPVFGHLTSEQRQGLIASRSAQKTRHLDQIMTRLSLAVQPNYWTLPNLPTSYICGDKDDKFSDIGKNLLAKNTTLSLYQCADSGHNVHQEASDQFLAFIRPLLTRNRPTS